MTPLAQALLPAPAPTPWGQGKGRKLPTADPFPRVLPTAPPHEGRQTPEFSRNVISQNPLHFCISMGHANKLTAVA
jgi:hypothetical protein